MFQPKCQFQMYESRCYEKSAAVEANGTVMERPNERLHCFYLMKYVLYIWMQEDRDEDPAKALDRPTRHQIEGENTVHSLPSVSLSLFPRSWILFSPSFSLHQSVTFPLKENWGLYRVRVDGACPCCSGSQVQADNCRVCAAETDDYRVYCLSQAQSTLIQQSHLSLIYDSTSLSLYLPYIPIPYLFLAGSKLFLMSLLAQ